MAKRKRPAKSKTPLRGPGSCSSDRASRRAGKVCAAAIASCPWRLHEPGEGFFTIKVSADGKKRKKKEKGYVLQHEDGRVKRFSQKCLATSVHCEICKEEAR
jgi:hypothetical protein